MDHETDSKCTHVGIPQDKVDLVGRFGVGDTIKVRSRLGYNWCESCLLLKAEYMEIVMSVKVIVK